MPETTLNRRAFLGVSVAVGTSSALAPLRAPGAVGAKNANETLRVGVVGPGGRGTGLLNECIEHGERYNSRVTVGQAVAHHKGLCGCPLAVSIKVGTLHLQRSATESRIRLSSYLCQAHKRTGR